MTHLLVIPLEINSRLHFYAAPSHFQLIFGARLCGWVAMAQMFVAVSVFWCLLSVLALNARVVSNNSKIQHSKDNTTQALDSDYLGNGQHWWGEPLNIY